MKTFIKTIKTITAVLMIIAGLTALFTIDNAQNITSLLLYAMTMIIGLTGGIYLLILTYPELTDLSEFDGDNNSIFNEYDREIEELREQNLLLINRYSTFKSILKVIKDINESNKMYYPNLYHIIYEEDLRVEENNSKKEVEEELDRLFKEIYT